MRYEVTILYQRKVILYGESPIEIAKRASGLDGFVSVVEVKELPPTDKVPPVIDISPAMQRAQNQKSPTKL